MTKAAAMHSFWSGFGLPAYEENSVPTGDLAPAFPYITYELITDDLGESTFMSASVWYRSPSWVDANAKADEIGRFLGNSGVLRSCSGGRLWIKRATPFSSSMGDPSDDLIKRKMLNISVDFLTLP